MINDGRFESCSLIRGWHAGRVSGKRKDEIVGVFDPRKGWACRWRRSGRRLRGRLLKEWGSHIGGNGLGIELTINRDGRGRHVWRWRYGSNYSMYSISTLHYVLTFSWPCQTEWCWRGSLLMADHGGWKCRTFLEPQSSTYSYLKFPPQTSQNLRSNMYSNLQPVSFHDNCLRPFGKNRLGMPVEARCR